MAQKFLSNNQFMHGKNYIKMLMLFIKHNKKDAKSDVQIQSEDAKI